MQQPFTIIQPYHLATSTKGHSRSSKNKLASQPLSENDTNRISSRRFSRKHNQRNKESTTRPLNDDEKCPFHFVIFLAMDDDWYLSTIRKGYTKLFKVQPVLAYLYQHEISQYIHGANLVL